jgi:N-acetylglucosaminyl-diphospho-decaprenol L-rhamnosyltransferase
VDISIIIVNWNSVAYLQACVRSVYQHTRGLHFEILVVDSASFDGCGEMLAREYPQVRFIQSDKNLGFARSNNLAARSAEGRFLLFLNPDTELREPALDKLLAAAGALPDAGVLGARLLNSDGTLQTSCLQAFPTVANQVLDAELLRQWFPRSRVWGTAALYAESLDPCRVEGVSGACLMTPRAVFDQVGGFCEDYFMYYEDMDYCLKVRRAGRNNYYVPTAVVVHHGGKSSGGEYSRSASVVMAESGWRFFRAHHGWGHAVLFRVCMAAKAVSRVGLLMGMRCLVPSARRREQARAALGKWVSVLRWSFGSEKAAAHIR